MLHRTMILSYIRLKPTVLLRALRMAVMRDRHEITKPLRLKSAYTREPDRGLLFLPLTRSPS